MRVVLIGPVRPFRGGIAHHTTMVHRTLRKRAPVLTVSFIRQYPRWLYPGTSDREPDLSDFVESGVEYLLDSVNPLTWAKTLGRIAEYSPDLVVMPWWHVYWTPCFGWLAARLQRSGIKIVFICHNVIEHHGKRWTRLISRMVLAHGSRHLVHSAEDRNELSALLPGATIAVHPIPVFEDFPSPSKSPVRRAPTELLFFGFVRPYKGLDVLLEALTLLKERDFRLTVAGEFWAGATWAARFVEQHDLEGKVEFVPRYVSESEAAEFFARADAVVLPYRTATNSGVVALAYHYDKPVIASDVGGLPDVVEHGATGLLVKPGSPTDLAEALKVVMTGPGWYDADRIAGIKERLTWDSFVAAILGEEGTS